VFSVKILYSLALRYLTALTVLVVLDAIWLSYSAHALFRPALGAILLDAPRWLAAGLFYLLYAGGIVVLAVTPALKKLSWVIALGHGALIGFLSYMTYDLTNLASLKARTNLLAIVDVAWGTLLTSLASAASFAVTSRFAKEA
jgi:uncharacterized membrane protein